METLLCSPVSRLNIVLGKFLMVLTASITTMLLSLGSMGVSVTLGVASFGGGGKMQVAQQAAKKAGNTIPIIDPMGLFGVFALIAPAAVLFAAGLLTISLFAKSYKEAQSYVSPLIIVVIMPAVIGMLPGIELSAKTACIPILNLSLVCKEMLSGVWHWNFIALIFGSTCLYAMIVLTLCVKMFNRESVMFRA
jgi:sodium transport system permease protein